ncbi:DUF5676 family membrane protein [Zhongshania guokunii]|jgi:hypothetical protein|uniref:DUF5676 family membrane protein n=1 Tax=Zhongshania guokunii TaxID=641783 RepID=A0ABV3U8G0_9GAMM
MTINAFKFGVSSAITAAVLWLICSALVMLMPTMMLSMSGNMLHMQLNEMGWHLTLIGVVQGLVAWIVSAGIAGWLLATIYNRLQNA